MAIEDRDERPALMEPMHIPDALLDRGRLDRSEPAQLLGVSDHQARRVVQSLTGAGVLHAPSSRAPLQLAFPATLASSWMPGLFPDEAG